MRIINASWRGLGPSLKLLLHCRDGERRRSFLVDAPEKPWFMIPKDQSTYDFRQTSDKFYDKVEADCPTDVTILREQYDHHCMADVPWTRRVFIDHGIHLDLDLNGGIKPSSQKQRYKKLYYDIECWNKDGFPLAYKDPIVSIGAVNEAKERFFFHAKAGESYMLLDFFKLASQYDVLIGFNSERFDQPYLDTRAKLNGVPVDWKFWQLFDFQQMYKKAMWKVKPPLESYTLENIAQEELGETKLDIAARTWDLYLNDIDQLRDYNLKDCELVRKLDEKCKVSDTFIPLCEFSGNFLEDAKYYSRICDTLLLRAAYKRHEVLPTKPYIAREYGEDVSGGGYVLEPTLGLIKGCSSIDWGQMYPSNMRTWGISFENCFPDGTIIIPDYDGEEFYDDSGIHFREGDYLMPAVLKDLMEERSKIKKTLPSFVDIFNYESVEQFNTYMRQYIIKIILNTFSGSLRYPKSRYFNADAGEAVTASGRWVLGNSLELLKDEDKPAVMADSVSPDTCIPILENGILKVVPVSEIETKDIELQDRKEVASPKTNVYTYTREGWKRISKIIRHKTDKPLAIYGYMESAPCITNDHSLISRDSVIKPSEVKSQEELVHIQKIDIPTLSEISIVDEIELNHKYGALLGAYIAEGSITTRDSGLRIAGSRDREWIKKLYGYATDLFGDDVYLTESSATGSLYLAARRKLGLASLFGGLCGRGSKNKHLPWFVFNAPREFKEALVEHYILGDGQFTETGCRFSTISRKLASQMAFLLMLKGYHISVNPRDISNKPLPKGYIRSQKRVSYKISASQLDNPYSRRTIEGHKVRHSVKAIEPDEKHEYVYDIQVEDTHEFMDALGGIMLHNTDGMVTQCSKEDAIDISAYITDYMSETIKSQFGRKSYLTLDYKDYGDIFILSKKRYAWRPVNPETGEKGKIQVHGVEAKRTDWPLITKETQKKLFDMIFNSENPREEIAVLLETLKENIYAGKLVPKMIVQKSASREFADYTMPPLQARVAKEINQEGTFHYYPGEKIPYICDGYLEGIQHAVHPSKFDGLSEERKKFAYDYTWHFQLLPPIYRCLQVLGVEEQNGVKA